MSKIRNHPQAHQHGIEELNMGTSIQSYATQLLKKNEISLFIENMKNTEHFKWKKGTELSVYYNAISLNKNFTSLSIYEKRVEDYILNC